MKKDKFQYKYEEVFQQLKEERLDWDFDDFLESAEPKSTKIIQKNLQTLPNRKPRRNFALIGLAASLVLLVGLFLVFKKMMTPSGVENQRLAVQINNQKNAQTELIENNISLLTQVESVVSRDSSGTQNTPPLHPDSATESRMIPVDKIVSKKERLRKKTKQYLAKNNIESQEINSEYKANYVIINGQKIDNEKDALEVAKYSLQMLSTKVSKTLANTNDNTNVDDY